MQIQNKPQVLKQLKNVKKQIKHLADNVVKIVAELTYSFVITDWRKGGDYGSPILKGVFINNHVLSVNSPSSEVKNFPEATETSPKPAPSISEVAATINSIKVGDTVYITNNLDYADKIEREGYSAKTPRGVYKVSALAAANELAFFDWKRVMKSKGISVSKVKRRI